MLESTFVDNFNLFKNDSLATTTTTTTTHSPVYVDDSNTDYISKSCDNGTNHTPLYNRLCPPANFYLETATARVELNKRSFVRHAHMC